MVLAPRKSVILRGDDADLPRDEDGGEQKKEEEPLGEWHQVRRSHGGLATRTARPGANARRCLLEYNTAVAVTEQALARTPTNVQTWNVG